MSFQLASQSVHLHLFSLLPMATPIITAPPPPAASHPITGIITAWSVLIGSVRDSVAVFRFIRLSFSQQALKVLRTAEYAPLVVFIAAPSMSALAELRSSINVSHPLYQTHRPGADPGLGQGAPPRVGSDSDLETTG